GSRRHIVGCGGDALLGGARIGRHGIGGLVEIARAHFELHGRPAQLAQRAFDRMLKLRDGERVSLRCACARPASVWMAASFSRSIMLSRNTITVRAISPISSRALVAGMRALVSPAASCCITPARPLSGRVMLRPISQLKPRPNAIMAMLTAIMPVRVWPCDTVSANDASSTV